MQIPGKNKDTQTTDEKWKIAKLISSKNISIDVKSLIFSVKDWEKHIPGQHYEIALTSSDGYRAVREYSIASEPEKIGILEFGVQLMPHGEVSPYLFDMEIGEEIEIRGPLGGHFNWNISLPGPLILIGGGSGVVPLMSMLRHYLNYNSPREIVLLVSSKSIEKIPYKDELDKIKNSNIKIFYALTRDFLDAPNFHNGRIDIMILKELLSRFVGKMPMIYVCGTNSFVESITEDLIDIGFNSHEIKTERFN
jgi:ferredoxin-NADP reductase